MLENISPLREVAHLRCRHKHYRLTCAQLDALLIEARGRCQVCRAPGEPEPRQMLFIDHDAYRGDWAVRGLLCNRCNTILGKDLEVPRDDAFAAYLANSWFIRMLASLGVGPDVPEEPPVGAVVRLGDRRPRMWRSPGGWVRTGRSWPGSLRTWWELYRSAGPHKLAVVGHHTPRSNGRW
jgi:hypothetical protein